MAFKKGIDPEIAQLWGEEAERRYQEFLDGKVEAVPGEEEETARRRCIRRERR